MDELDEDTCSDSERLEVEVLGEEVSSVSMAARAFQAMGKMAARRSCDSTV